MSCGHGPGTPVPHGEYSVAPIGARLRETAATRGWPATLAALAGWSAGYAAGLPATLGASRRSFSFQGTSYPYLSHRHNHTWLGERAVEIPVIAAAVRAARGRRVLEVGNVLGHYGDYYHDVIDKYERAPGVRNVDVLDLQPDTPYELIVSISTLEHVGFDDEPRDPQRAVAAVGHLRNLLAPGGRLLATVPVGYNPALVAAMLDGRAGLQRVDALRREGRGLRWREVPAQEVADLPYDHLLYRAPAVLFGMVGATS